LSLSSYFLLAVCGIKLAVSLPYSAHIPRYLSNRCCIPLLDLLQDATKGYGLTGHAPGFILATVSLATIEGLLLIVGLKGLGLY
jgi:hypothetical protein